MNDWERMINWLKDIPSARRGEYDVAYHVIAPGDGDGAQDAPTDVNVKYSPETGKFDVEADCGFYEFYDPREVVDLIRGLNELDDDGDLLDDVADVFDDDNDDEDDGDNFFGDDNGDEYD